MHKKQIETKSVELTWIFTQSIFMAINTVLWTLSYYEIRGAHPRGEVEQHLQVALHCITKASERWPGVASALELYHNLIKACMKIYDKDGDIPIAAGSPAESHTTAASPGYLDATMKNERSRNSSPATASSQSIRTPPTHSQPPFGYIDHRSYGSASNASTHSPSTSTTSPPQGLSVAHQNSQGYFGNMPAYNDYDPGSQYNPLPTNFPDLGPWNPSFNFTTSAGQHHHSLDLPAIAPLDSAAAMRGNFSTTNSNHNGFSSMHHPMSSPANANPAPPVTYADYLYPQATASWTMEAPDLGLNREQQLELMDCLQTDSGQIRGMIRESDALFHPSSLSKG